MMSFRDEAGSTSPYAVTLDLRPAWRPALLLVLAVLLAGAYEYRVLRSFLASRQATIADLPHLQQAARLEPGNAEYRHRLGRYLALAAQDMSGGMAEFRAATQLNPHGAAYWLDLARAYQFLGDHEQHKRALESAVAADPRTPEIAWEAANFYLVQGDVPRALRHFRIVVENDPERSLPALALCWRASRDIRPILDHVLPPTPEAHAALLYFLLHDNHTAAADNVWQRLIALNQPFNPQLAMGYLQYLLGHRDVERAYAAWQDLARINPGLRSYRRDDDLVTNGSFEQQILNGAFDWRYTPVENVSVALDDSEFHSGLHSLSILFDRQAARDPGLQQLVPVEPNTEYQFTAYVRARDLEGANGAQFVVADAYSGRSYAMTDEILGSTAWRRVSAQFRTDRDTRLLAISLVRSSRLTLLRGALWIDDISVKKK